MSNLTVVSVTPEEFATYLKRCRNDKKLTHNEVAATLGINHGESVYHWEVGFSFPAPKHIKTLAVLYGVNYGVLKELLIGVKVHQTISNYNVKFKEVEMVG